MSVDNTGKKQRAGFKPGRSGNPKGRPVGARNKATIAVESLLDGEAEAITRRCIELAMAGDITAIRICMDRICPPRKERPLSLSLSHPENPSDLAGVMAEVFSAMGRGEITPSEAQVVAGLVEVSRRGFETREIELRLSALERAAR